MADRKTSWRSAADCVRFAAGSAAAGSRHVAEETPVALSFNGTSFAVMMATPADLEDFGVGFALSEGIVRRPDEISSVEMVEVDGGIDLQMWLVDDAADRLEKRRRRIAGPVGCGLCGIDSISEAVRATPAVRAPALFSARQISEAVRLLSDNQPLFAETRAVHAAGFYLPGEGIVAVREDVGRHNALDKLAGALARQGTKGSHGAVVITSRVSLEMVQKTATIGAGVLIAVSAPTALAIRTAHDAGIALVALARGNDFDVYTHAGRIADGALGHVA